MRPTIAGAILVAVAAVPASLSRAGGEPEIVAGIRKASTCLAAHLDGRGFKDPYLTYVYPGEALPVPPGAPPITYRKVDADVILALLPRRGAVPEPLAEPARRAREELEALAPVWRERGIDNLRKGAAAPGIALDTYCLVGWLAQDARIASRVESGIDGDAWLAGDLFKEEERFRREADECWCLRLLASPAGPGLGRASAVLDRIVRTFREAVRRDPAGREAFYDAYHLALVAAEISSAGRSLPDHERSLEGEIVEAFRLWAGSRGGVKGGGDPDLLEWANLAAAEIPDSPAARSLKRQAVERILASQGEDGCLALPGAGSAGRGTDFLTLRALLALASNRDQPDQTAARQPTSTSGSTIP